MCVCVSAHVFLNMTLHISYEMEHIFSIFHTHFALWAANHFYLYHEMNDSEI